MVAAIKKKITLLYAVCFDHTLFIQGVSFALIDKVRITRDGLTSVTSVRTLLFVMIAH